MQVTSPPQWLGNARAFEAMMIKEQPGFAAHPLIQAFLQYTQLAGQPAGETDETPWCSAFACACMELAGFKSPRHALAHSWLTWGVLIPELREGCILVFEKPNHVAFCDAVTKDGTHVIALGGNQHNQVCSRLLDRKRLISMRWING